MKRYEVEVIEITRRTVTIEAASAEAARREVQNGVYWTGIIRRTIRSVRRSRD